MLCSARDAVRRRNTDQPPCSACLAGLSLQSHICKAELITPLEGCDDAMRSTHLLRRKLDCDTLVHDLHWLPALRL